MKLEGKLEKKYKKFMKKETNQLNKSNNIKQAKCLKNTNSKVKMIKIQITVHRHIEF